MAADPDLDDMAFLSGGDDNARQKKDSIVVCSQKRALCVAFLVCGSILMTAFIVAFGGQSGGCPCSSENTLDVKSKSLNGSEFAKPLATNGDPFPWLDNKLPTFAKPLLYSITVHPNLTTYDVKGQVAIDLIVEEETQFVVIHSQSLNVTEKAIMVSGSRGQTIKITRLLEFPQRQQLYIEFKDKLKKKHNYTLNLRWYSRLQSEPDGFYVDHYKNRSGQQRSLAATVFQPHGARKYFPCFNEPHYRTPFRVSIFRDRFHIALSNTNVLKTEDVGFYMGTGLLRDDFMETPHLPSDSVSWVISDFLRESLDMSSYSANYSSKNIQDKKILNNSLSNAPKKLSGRSITSLTHSLNLKVLSTNISYPSTTNVLTSKNISARLSYTFYAPDKNLLARADSIMKTAKDVLTCLESWLNIKYPLPKLDFVALPSLDKNIFSSLGLINLKISFLMDQKSTTTKDNQLSAIRISEAIVQQFFGGITWSSSLEDNIIWDGLVKYLAVLILSTLRQHWPLKEMNILHYTTRTMDQDALQGWSSIINATNDNGYKDEFYTDKSVAVFGMLHLALGETRFRQCLGRFLKENFFKTEQIMALWTSCKSDKLLGPEINVEEMMSVWMNQQGFPLVSVSKYGKNITLTQRIFKIDDSLMVTARAEKLSNASYATKSTNSNKIKWIFPITYVTDRNNTPVYVWMNKQEVSFQLHEETKWIKLNTGQTGLYRITYNLENWLNITRELSGNHSSFSPEDRVGLLSDAFALCHSNLISCDIIMSMIQYLPNETKWGPMTLALGHLERWRRILKYSECFLMLSEYIKIQLKSIVEKIGLIDEGSIDTKMMRPAAFLALILWEDAGTILKSKDILNTFLNNNADHIPPNLREAIYTGAILSGEYIYWQFCWEKFIALQQTPGNYTERMQLVRALGRTKDVWLQNRLLSHITMLPTNEVVEVLQSIAGTPVGGAIGCRFLQANWFEFQARLGRGTESFAKVISIITQYGATNFDYDELNSLVYRFGSGPGLNILKMTMRNVASNVEWVSKSQTSIFKWIESNLHVN